MLQVRPVYGRGACVREGKGKRLACKLGAPSKRGWGLAVCGPVVTDPHATARERSCVSREVFMP